jgi:hypothetical protein
MKLESLDLTRIKLDDNLHLSGTSARKQAARKRMAAATNFKALKPEHVSKFLENRLKRLYERVKINGALTNEKIFKYLSLFTSASIPVLGDFPRKNQKMVIKKFATSTRDIVDKISDEGFLEQKQVQDVKLGIIQKSIKLIDQDKNKRAEIVDDIGIDISKVSEESQKNETKIIKTEILNEKIIPIGLSKNPEFFTVWDFLQLPLGEKKSMIKEEDYFKEHILYLNKAVESKLFPANKLKTILDIIPEIKKIKFKKYFQTFIQDDYKEPTFMAVISLWANNALKNLKE